MFDDLPEEICEMFKDGRETITIIEVTDENTEPNSYEVPIAYPDNKVVKDDDGTKFGGR
jgi:hypothetical protein